LRSVESEPTGLPIETEPIKNKQPKPERTFRFCFKDTPSIERLLDASVSIVFVMDQDKYQWLEEGSKSHRVCAFWYAAVDAGLIKANLRNKKATTIAIREFFNMELSHDTLEKVYRENKEYKKIKKAIEERLKTKSPDIQ
jgi:hypothetical protein